MCRCQFDGVLAQKMRFPVEFEVAGEGMVCAGIIWIGQQCLVGLVQGGEE